MPIELDASEPLDLVWTCACCGKEYKTLSFAYALDQPDAWCGVPEAQRRHRATLGTDTCTIDGKRFFVRGRVLLPVEGFDDPFIWGCWASVSKETFEAYGKFWDVPNRADMLPFEGTLASDIPLYPATAGLRCKIQMRDARKRPSFILESTDHSLAMEQRNGITLDRVKEIASTILQHRKDYAAAD